MQPNVRSLDAGPAFEPLYASFANADITTSRVVLAPAANGARWIVDDLLTTSEAAQNITLKDDGGSVILGPLYCPAGGLIPWTLRNRILLGANKGLNLFGDAAGNVKAIVSYHVRDTREH